MTRRHRGDQPITEPHHDGPTLIPVARDWKNPASPLASHLAGEFHQSLDVAAQNLSGPVVLSLTEHATQPLSRRNLIGDRSGSLTHHSHITHVWGTFSCRFAGKIC